MLVAIIATQPIQYVLETRLTGILRSQLLRYTVRLNTGNGGTWIVRQMVSQKDRKRWSCSLADPIWLLLKSTCPCLQVVTAWWAAQATRRLSDCCSPTRLPTYRSPGWVESCSGYVIYCLIPDGEAPCQFFIQESHRSNCFYWVKLLDKRRSKFGMYQSRHSIQDSSLPGHSFVMLE